MSITGLLRLWGHFFATDHLNRAVTNIVARAPKVTKYQNHKECYGLHSFPLREGNSDLPLRRNVTLQTLGVPVVTV
jgi:hypothetical protein